MTQRRITLLSIAASCLAIAAPGDAPGQTSLVEKAIYECSLFPSVQAISPDGNTIALPLPGSVKLISSKTGAVTRIIPVGSISSTTAVAFTPDSRRVIVGGAKFQIGAPNNGILEVLDIQTGSLLASLPTSAGFVVRSVSITPDGRTLISGGANLNSTTHVPSGILEIWNLSTYKLSGTLSTGAVDSVDATTLSADGSKLAIGGENASATAGGVVELWDLKTKKLIHSFPTRATEYVVSVSLSADGGQLASGGSSYQATTGTSAGVLELWSTATGKLLSQLPTQQSYGLDQVQFSPNSKILADVGMSQTSPVGVETWDTSTFKSTGTLNVSGLNTTSLAFFPGGTSLSIGVQGISSGKHVAGVEIWSTKTWALTHEFLSDSGERFSRSVPIPGTASILFAGQSSLNGKVVGRFGTWNSGQQVLSELPSGLEASGGTGTAVAVTTDGNIGAVSGQIGTAGLIELWDMASRKLLRTFPTTATIETALAFSPDGSLLASTGRSSAVGGILELWSVSTGKLLGSVVRSAPLVSVRFSPNGQQIACGELTNLALYGGSGDVLVINTSNRAITNVLGNQGLAPITGLAFSPDGTILAACGNYNDSTLSRSVGTIQLWNPINGASIGSLPVQTEASYVPQIAFSPDGGSLFAYVGTYTITNYLQAFDPVSLKLKVAYPMAPLLPLNSIGFLNSGQDLFLGGSLPLIVAENDFYTPFLLNGFSISPGQVAGGKTATASITLANPAPIGGLTILLKSDKKLAIVPAQVRVAAGSRTATFSVKTTKVTASGTATVTATVGTASTSAKLTVN